MKSTRAEQAFDTAARTLVDLMLEPGNHELKIAAASSDRGEVAMLLGLLTEICTGAISYMASEAELTYDEALCQIMAVVQWTTADNRLRRPAA